MPSDARGVAAALGLVLLTCAAGAHAQADPQPLHSDNPADTRPPWEPKRTLHIGVADFVVSGAAAAAALGAAIVPPLPKHVYGGVAIDEDVRDALRVRSLEGRYAVRDASDVGLSLEATWPFFVDALITTWWWRGRPDIARKMAIVDAEALLLTGAIQGWTNTLVSRERPYGRLCGNELPADSIDCTGNVRYRSFFSGHSALSFTSASLLCYHHVGMGILGGAADIATCVMGYAVATTTALFRVAADMHYTSDIALGAVVGTVIGLGIPWLHARPAPPTTSSGFNIRLAPVGQGLGVVGGF